MTQARKARKVIQGHRDRKAIQGHRVPEGDTGAKGDKGDTGATGRTAYESAVAGGFVGTETEFNTRIALAYDAVQLALAIALS